MIARSRTLALLALLGGSLVACGIPDEDLGLAGGGGVSSDGSDGADGADGSDGTDDSGGDGEEEATGFKAPGDILTFDDDGGDATVALTDISDDPGSNREQEFYLVVVNTGEDELGYQLRYEESEDDSDASAAARRPAARPAALPTPARQLLRDRIASGELDHSRTPYAPPPPYDETDIGDAFQEFRVRNSLEDDTESATVRARLWAVGDSVTIWVDDFMPFNVYNDCDDTAQGYAEYHDDAFGFDNCDLATIANIVDTNIVPNLTDAYGEASDVNSDGRVSIVITPVLNRLTQGTDDELLEGTLVGSYADPEVDLVDYDVDENPLSDEQEVIYVHAPDPYGYFNNEVPVDLDAYTGMELAAQIARAYTRLISYNNKVLADTAGGDAEEGWLLDGLGALGADLTGFGAVNYDDVWRYLDAPHLAPLVVAEDAGAISTQSVGAQYLFLRWLVDTQEPQDPSEGTLLQQLMTTTNIGADAISSVTGKTFVELVVAWQVALLTTGVTNVDGEPLVPALDPDTSEPSDWPPYLAASTLTAPTESPTAGDYYGANGYQQGVYVRGMNLYMENGTTDSPSEVTGNRVVTSGTDPLTLATGLPFFGFLAEDYAAQVVRLVDIPYATAALVIDGNSENFSGAVIRWNDPGEPDYTVEDVFSSTSAATVGLPLLDPDGAPLYGLGIIGSPGATYVVDAGSSDNPTGEEGDSAEPEYESGDIYDTDRWSLDMTGFPASEEYEIVIEFKRHYANADGEIGPADPWVAVVPANLVPTPTVTGTNNDFCPTATTSFAYPASIMEHLFWQTFLSPVAVGDETAVSPWSGIEGSEATAFDPCGEATDLTATCEVDWDSDGVLDEDEPTPGSFVQQVQVQQCTLTKNPLGVNQLPLDSYVGEEIIDRDELDTDDTAYYDQTRNLGGRTDSSGEDAYLERWLRGGQEYVIVVGAGSDEGPYEFSVKVLNARSVSTR